MAHRKRTRLAASEIDFQLTCAEMNERFNADLDCYGSIQDAIQEEVQEMVDQSSAQAWSTAGDQLADDVAEAGFDPESIVVLAEFGDATAVNGDIDNEKTVAGLEAELERDGYEYLDQFGGRVPTTEGYAYGDHVIDAVAKKLKVPAKQVEAAAKALDWWQEEIPGSSSGHTYVWAKKAKGGTEEARRRSAGERTTMSRAEADDLWHRGNNAGHGYAPYTDVPGDDTIDEAVAAAERDGWSHHVEPRARSHRVAPRRPQTARARKKAPPPLRRAQRGTELHTWFERDRAHVELRDSIRQQMIIEWWDEAVAEAVEDGFLNPRDWHGSAYRNAIDAGLLRPAPTVNYDDTHLRTSGPENHPTSITLWGDNNPIVKAEGSDLEGLLRDYGDDEEEWRRHLYEFAFDSGLVEGIS